MKVLNIHERTFAAPPERVGALVDSLSSLEDSLWPIRAWPPMTFDRTLSVGAVGGHGPIRYVVEAYAPGRRVRFRFTGPRGFDGHHEYAVLGATPYGCTLRHTLDMVTHGPATLSWPVVFRPMHDALLEDSLALAQAAMGESPDVRTWTTWVKVLRWLLSRGRSRAQVAPTLRAGGPHPAAGERPRTDDRTAT